MNTGNLIAFVTYAMQILMSFMMLSMIFVLVPRAQASAVRIQAVLNQTTTIVNNDKAEKIDQDMPDLHFDNVTYRYHHAEEPALSDVDFHVTAGQTLAVIGGTGSGKSTLINLIPRFYDAESGEVKVNGANVKDVDLADLRRNVSMVPQKAILFAGTVRSNMQYANDNATDEQIWHALDIAQASDFIHANPEGLDYVVEQGGDNFSGGQKQRLAIARALINDAAVYVFYDSFSALDFKTDANLRAALKEDPVISHRVVVIVGQRVSTVADADQIVVLDEGKMVGLGTHKELLASNETYKEIVNSQIRKGDEL